MHADFSGAEVNLLLRGVDWYIHLLCVSICDKYEYGNWYQVCDIDIMLDGHDIHLSN